MSPDTVTPIQACLSRLVAGDPHARGDLLLLSRDRLLAMVRAMMARFSRLRRWVESEDVLQDVQIRLDRALREARFVDGRQFLAVASRHIRYQLLDLVKRYFGPHGAACHYETPDPADDRRAEEALACGDDPALLAEWAELQGLIDGLPDDLREVFDLHVVQGMTWGEVSAAVGMTVRAARGKLLAAKVWLAQRLGRQPTSEFWPE